MIDAEKLADILRTLIEVHGFQPPILFAMIAINGSTVTGYYYQHDDHLECKFTSQILKDHFTLPVNIMFVDSSTGNAVRVVLNAKQEHQYFLN
jgi:hypothetical protein